MKSQSNIHKSTKTQQKIHQNIQNQEKPMGKPILNMGFPMIFQPFFS